MNSDLKPSELNVSTANINETEIKDLLIYKRNKNTDERGFFKEVVELKDLEEKLNKKIEIKQWNHSNSKPRILRGIHAEPWEKLIYVAKGKALSVVVDLRIDSPTFGKAVKTEMGDTNDVCLYLPVGMGNSFCNIGETDVDFMYLVTEYYQKGISAPSIFWNDPLVTRQFGGWPIENPTISEKDKNLPTLTEEFGSKVDFSKFSWLRE